MKVSGFLNSLFLSSLVFANIAVAGDPSWIEPHAPYQISDNIYNVGTAGIGVYLITTPKGHILLDGSPKEGAAIVEANIKTLGFKLTDVKYLLESHAHYDHVAGLAKLKADTHAQFLASAGDKPALEKGQHFGDNEYGLSKFPKIKVDRTLNQGDKVTLGGVTLTAQLTPGHTKGCTSWTMETSSNGVNRSVIFLGSLTVAGNKLIDNKTYPNIVDDYHTSFARLKTLTADILLTAHPSFAELEEKYQAQLQGKKDAFVNPEEFPKLVADMETGFEKELENQKQANHF